MAFIWLLQVQLIFISIQYILEELLNPGTNNTYALAKTNNTATINSENNIFVNNRTNSGGSGTHYAYYLNGTNNLTSDYNIYNAAGTGGVLASENNGANNRTTLQAYRAVISGQELHSGIGDPNFVAPVGNSSTVSLNVQSSTPAENSGLAISGISDDFYNSPRPTPPNSSPDIGADEGNFTGS